jgi:hypothetical protein
MGGRGASSGISVKGNEYGTQYRTLLTSGNIVFVTKEGRSSEPLMETMTKRRIYVTVGGNDLISITYFDKNNKRSKTIHLNHPHKGMKPHTHHGYLHSENDGPKGASNLSNDEKKMVDLVNQLWHNHLAGG